MIARVVGVGRVNTQTSNATSVRLKLGTDAAVTTGVIFTSAQTPTSEGWATHVPTGLAAGAGYYYRVAVRDSLGAETLDTCAVGEFKTPPTGQTSFAFNASSCCDATDSAAMASIAARRDDLFLHLGDAWYNDGGAKTIANYRTQMENKLRVTNHAAVYSTTPSSWTPSDHDFGMNDGVVGATDTVARDLYNQAYRELLPVEPVPTTTGVYHTFTWGRARFIMLDGRTFKSANADADNASKTILGAGQKHWLKDTLTAASEQLIVIACDVPWAGAAFTPDDEWRSYNTERQELVTFFNQSGRNIAYVAGDMHAVAADDGTNGFGIPSFQASPLNNQASIKAGPYTAGPYPASGTATVQQYGRFVVTDSGTSIALAYTGYSSDNTARVSYTKTYTTEAPSQA